MPRYGIADLPKPPRRFRPGRRRSDRFETTKKVRDEDALRVRRLRKAAHKFGKEMDLAAAEDLIKRLSYSKIGKRAPDTLASSRRMRRYRIRVAGWLWRLIERGKFRDVSVVHLVPTDLRFTAEQLEGVDPRRLLERLRADLNRKGASKADGWAFFALHGEFEPNSETYQLHFHGVAADGMVAVVDRLRQCRKYKRPKGPKRQRKSVFRPIVRSRKPLTNLPEPLTYILKAFWPLKRIGVVNDDGDEFRDRMGKRIPEPFHSQVLLWLDRWTLSDITMLMKLSATSKGFKLTKSVKRNSR